VCAEEPFLRYSCTKFYDSLTEGLITDTESQTDRQVDFFCT